MKVPPAPILALVAAAAAAGSAAAFHVPPPPAAAYSSIAAPRAASARYAVSAAEVGDGDGTADADADADADAGVPVGGGAAPPPNAPAAVPPDPESAPPAPPASVAAPDGAETVGAVASIWDPTNRLIPTPELRSRHRRPPSFATKCASHYSPRDGADRGLSPPVYFASTFLLDGAAHGARLHGRREGPYTDVDGFVYSRWGSPTNEAAALQVAALEGVDSPRLGMGAGGTLLFNSGMSAITASLTSVLRSGDHAVFPLTVYGGTHEFLTEFASYWGVEISYVDAAGPSGPDEYREAFRDNTRVVYAETPANPTCRLTDLVGLGRAVDERYGKADDAPGTDPRDRSRPWVVVDGTFATPYHQRVLDVPGIDVSVHSATKYLGGHSDVLAGSVTSRSEPFLHGCSKVQKLISAPLNPMDSFLLSRGLKTLDVRMQRHGENAMKVARMLEGHPMVARVFYPGLDSHPDRAMADGTFRSGRDDDQDQDDGDGDDADDADSPPRTYGGMISFVVLGEGDDALRRARNVCEYLRVINLAVSLGGVESLCEHPASMTHAMIPRERRLRGGLHDGLIRISVGLESASDLVEDLRNALDLCDEDGCDVEYDV